MPYWRLSAVYFLYFAVIGAMAPYWSLYLQSLGFGGQLIGALAAVPLFVRLFMPNVWGHIADALGRKALVLRTGAVGALLFYSLFLFFHEAWSIALILFFYACFWSAVLAPAESLTLQYLGDRAHFYGRIRLWGSIGFVVSVLVLGVAFAALPLSYLPFAVCAQLVLLVLVCLSFGDNSNELAAGVDAKGASFKDFWSQLGRLPVAMFFIVCFLLHASHGPYYVFFSIYLEQLGYTRVEIGCFWTLGVVAEIVFFLIAHKLMRCIPPYNLLLISLFFTALRWLLLPSLAGSAYSLFFLQLLHAFSFAACHSVAMGFCRKRFGADQQSRAQAFYSSISFGAGGGVGAFFSGYLWQFGVELTFMVAAVIAVLAFVISCYFLRTILPRPV
ncbi:MFS transporter [Agaribacterium sp. ZY112]|uniref:MFS transporter n=1 Tax=Agaribacterium sp. ZY112 TaxID=3233574 RepID=UPI003524DA46